MAPAPAPSAKTLNPRLTVLKRTLSMDAGPASGAAKPAVQSGHAKKPRVRQIVRATGVGPVGMGTPVAAAAAGITGAGTAGAATAGVAVQTRQGMPSGGGAAAASGGAGGEGGRGGRRGKRRPQQTSAGLRDGAQPQQQQQQHRHHHHHHQQQQQAAVVQPIREVDLEAIKSVITDVRFDSFPLSAQMLSAVQQGFGFQLCTKVQAETMLPVLNDAWYGVWTMRSRTPALPLQCMSARTLDSPESPSLLSRPPRSQSHTHTATHCSCSHTPTLPLSLSLNPASPSLSPRRARAVPPTALALPSLSPLALPSVLSRPSPQPALSSFTPSLSPPSLPPLDLPSPRLLAFFTPLLSPHSPGKTLIGPFVFSFPFSAQLLDVSHPVASRLNSYPSAPLISSPPIPPPRLIVAPPCVGRRHDSCPSSSAFRATPKRVLLRHCPLLISSALPPHSLPALLPPSLPSPSPTSSSLAQPLFPLSPASPPALPSLSHPALVLIATPGRLLDHLKNTQGMQERVQGVQVLVLDEADRMLDMGFAKDLQAIMAYLPAARQTLLFSATMPTQVQAMSQQVLRREFKHVDVVGEEDADTNIQVRQEHLVVPLEEQLTTMYTLLLHHCQEQPDYKVLVFSVTAKMTAFYAALFASLLPGATILEIHSRKSQAHRTRVSGEFRAAKGRVVMFTSDVSARGVDYPDVSLVLQVGLPADRAQYIHRLGRTGRAGKEGHGVLLLSPWEKPFLPRLAGLPITPHKPLDPLSAQYEHKLNEALSRVETSAKEQAYVAFLGYYNSNLRVLKWTPQILVATGNEFAELMQCPEQPAIEPRLLGKMGLRKVAGIREAGRDHIKGYQQQQQRQEPVKGRGGRRW
ncbi:unnamed protein product [Closterium sp. NIES-53]